MAAHAQYIIQAFAFCKEIERGVWVYNGTALREYFTYYYRSRFGIFNSDALFI
jgi:hypothetical protein